MMKRLSQWIDNHFKVILGILGLLIVIAIGLPFFSSMYSRRISYDWGLNKLGLEKSDAPLGASYMKDYLVDSLGFEVIEYDAKARQLINSGACNVLMYNDSIISDKAIRRGTNVLYARYWDEGEYIHGFEENFWSPFSAEHIRDKYLDPAMENLFFPTPNDEYQGTLPLWSNMLHGYYTSDKFYYTTILKGNENRSYVVHRNMDRGKVTLVGCYFLATNYALCRPDTRKVMGIIMKQAYDRKKPLVICYSVVREGQKEYSEEESNSPFKVLLSNPTTALCLKILIAVMMLYVIINSRRRRTAYEEMPKEENASISYVRHLATIYNRQTDYKHLLKVEQRKLLYQLRRDFSLNLTTKDYTLPSQFADFVTKTKGWDRDAFVALTTQIEALTDSNAPVSYNDYKLCMKQLKSLLSPQKKK